MSTGIVRAHVSKTEATADKGFQFVFIRDRCCATDVQVIYGQGDVDPVVRYWCTDSDRVQVGGLVAVINFEVLAAFVWPAEDQALDLRAFERVPCVIYGIDKFTAATKTEQGDDFDRVEVGAEEKRRE